MGEPLDYPEAMLALIGALRKLPGIGPRSAERMALWLVRNGNESAEALAAALQLARTEVQACESCGFFTTETLCAVCQDPVRQGQPICVVEQASDILPLERAGVFRGTYHSLGGKLSPLDRVGPEQLRIETLMERVRTSEPGEVILALSGDVEGEATAGYLTKLLHEAGASVSRIAQGMPAGSSLESTDPVTLARAMEFRTRLERTG